jgi:glucose/arabinose dehydrogenase
MAIYNDNIILSVGDYRYRELAQNDDTFFGKIVKISLKHNKNVEIFSKGHRNPQGLIYYDQKKIISTEHGPRGGDEINFIIKDKNYGWPISSYGEHYDGIFRENAPLKNSHKDWGFQEPVEYFVPSIGISDLINVKKIFYNNGKNNLFVSSLKYKTLYLYELNDKLSKVQKIDSFSVGERIRDLTYVEKSNFYVMILEDGPSIGILFFD